MKLSFIAAALSLMAACESADAPRDPAWGKQACDACSMLVSEPRFAAQLVTTGDDRLYFDDAGCLAAWVNEHPGKAKHQWVRSSEGQWLEAPNARFSAGARTPMDYGFAVAARGELDWVEVRERVRSRVAERGKP